MLLGIVDPFWIRHQPVHDTKFEDWEHMEHGDVIENDGRHSESFDRVQSNNTSFKGFVEVETNV